jgi:alpha-N-acetylglucosamine transferase
MYTKLAIWNLTDYDRVLYLDADILISKPMYDIWDDPNSDPPSGLAGLSDPMGQNHEIPIPDNGYINAGLLLLRPSNVTFKRLVETRDFDYGLFEQVRGAKLWPGQRVDLKSQRANASVEPHQHVL